MRVKLSFVLRALLPNTASMLVLLLVTATACAGELIGNGGMEKPFVKGVAQGWRNGSYGKNVRTFSSGKPHSGKSSQQIACRSFEGGGIQFIYPLRVTAGKHYKVSLWLRAEGVVGMVNVGLYHVPAPYTRHLYTSFEPGESWQQYTLEGVSPESDEQAGLFVSLFPEASTTLWVDDVSVIEDGSPTVKQPLAAGNVVPNADFELAIERDWQGRRMTPYQDTQKPFHGQHSLRWDLDGSSAELVSRPLEFGTNGQPFTLAVSARASGQAAVTAELWPTMMIGVDRPLLKLDCQPGANWKVFRSSGPLPASNDGAYYLKLRLHSQQRVSVWLDALRLEPGNAETPFRCRRPVEASLNCAPVAHIFRQGAPVALELRAFSDGERPHHSELLCRVTDYWRHPVAEIPVPLDLKLRMVLSRQIQLPLEKTGIFLAELVDGEEVLGGTSFSVLPKVSPVAAKESAVGGHFRLNEFEMQVANAMGIKWSRIIDCETITHWYTAEPRQGHFVWYDDRVRVARKHGVCLLGELFRVPAWASTAGEKDKGSDVRRFPPRNMGDFAAYVRAVVNHYRNDIHDWEIWNEAYSTSFWMGTPEQYAAMAKVAVREVRAVDPRAIVMGPCIHPGGAEWFQKILICGALDGVQAFSYHGYYLLQPKSYNILQKWAAAGPAGPLPIWNTETGTISRTFYRHIPDKFVDKHTNWLGDVSYRVAAQNSAKLFIVALATGTKRYFQYGWGGKYEDMLPWLSSMSLFEYDTALRPMGVAYAVAASILDGCHGRGWFEAPGQVLVSLLEDDQRLIAVAWRCNGPRSRRIAVPIDPSAVEARDMMGNHVELPPHGAGFMLDPGPEPLYLLVPVEHAGALTEALKRAKPLEPDRP